MNTYPGPTHPSPTHPTPTHPPTPPRQATRLEMVVGRVVTVLAVVVAVAWLIGTT